MRPVTNQGSKQRKKRITKEQKWTAIAVQLDEAHQERKQVRQQAEDAALKWADRPSTDFSSPGIKAEVLALLSACKDPENRGIIAESFREAAEVCDNGRGELMHGIAERVSSGQELKVRHFLQGFATA